MEKLSNEITVTSGQEEIAIHRITPWKVNGSFLAVHANLYKIPLYVVLVG